MLTKILFAVDSSLSPREAATLAHGLLPKADEVVVLQVVPQLPKAWVAWPAFPDAGEELGKASAYVTEVAQVLEALGWNASTKVQFSVLSAAEVDREILKLADVLRPDLICLALEPGSAAANIVREATVPVLVAKTASPPDRTTGHRARPRLAPESALVCRALLLKPAGAWIFRRAGFL